MKQIMRFSESQILDWASKYYDEVLGSKAACKEAEIVDANLDVSDEEVAKADVSIREKFNAVFNHLKERLETNVNSTDKELESRQRGFNKGAFTWGISGVGIFAGAYLESLGNAVKNIPLNISGAALTAATICAAATIGVVDFCSVNKKRKQALELGLTYSELLEERQVEKAILKFVKKNDRLPNLDDDLGTDSQIYDIYLQLKMLNHKYLMEDKIQAVKEQSMGEE